jgi:hypothetical protein
MAFERLPSTRGKLRAQLYVNGYQYSKIIPGSGNFPLAMSLTDLTSIMVPSGIFNDNADNSIWTMDEVVGTLDI